MEVYDISRNESDDKRKQKPLGEYVRSDNHLRACEQEYTCLYVQYTP